MKSTPENHSNNTAIALYLKALKKQVSPEIFALVEHYAQLQLHAPFLWILFDSEAMAKAMRSNSGFQAAAGRLGVQVEIGVIESEDDKLEGKILDDLEAELKDKKEVKADSARRLSEILQIEGIEEITLTIKGTNRCESHNIWKKRKAILQQLIPAGNHPELDRSKIRLNILTTCNGKEDLYDYATVARPH